MPKLGMEPVRRAALVQATIAEIGAAGSLDVTVSQIAKRAGMSTGLAHHYFGSKEAIFLAAMRHILTSLGNRTREELAEAHTPRDRLNAIIAASFDPENYEPAVISAWLTFYVRAQNSAETRRLLRVYTKRLHSNLVFSLKEIVAENHAQQIAYTLGALIDGLYIRQALQDEPMDRMQTMATVWEYLDMKLKQWEN